MLTFSFGVSSNLPQQKSPTMEIIGIYFLGTIVPRKYMPKISAVGLFCCDKFEETPNEKVSKLSKLRKSYFSDNEKCTRVSCNGMSCLTAVCLLTPVTQPFLVNQLRQT